MTSTKTAQRRTVALQRHHQVAVQQGAAHRRRMFIAAWSLASVLIVVVVAAMMLSSRPTQSAVARTAPDFSLPTSAGGSVSLADLRGNTVLLYPNEGVGCDACFYQMADIESHGAQFTAAGITVLPLVMNSADQVRAELPRFGLHTPYLIDADGSVSRAYGVLGRGMHAGLPGHGFVLIDAEGIQRWYGEYPSMFVSSTDLLAAIQKHLPIGKQP